MRCKPLKTKKEHEEATKSLEEFKKALLNWAGLKKSDIQTKCSFPDCGCPEARLCMAGDPNEAALNLNRPKRSKYVSKD